MDTTYFHTLQMCYLYHDVFYFVSTQLAVISGVAELLNSRILGVHVLSLFVYLCLNREPQILSY